MTSSDDRPHTQPPYTLSSPVSGADDDWRTPFRRTPSPSSDDDESDRESLDEERGRWQPYDSQFDFVIPPPPSALLKKHCIPPESVHHK